jgi:hypothetical protein
MLLKFTQSPASEAFSGTMGVDKRLLRFIDSLAANYGPQHSGS